MLTKRLEILLDPKEFEILKKKAEAEGKSIANLVRETLKEKVIETDFRQKEKALQRLFSSAGDTSFGEWKEEKKKLIKKRVKEIETH